ncbi:SMC-Scp complex subunit ScpB [Candidatus Omnitrophota bacterium]
MEQQLIKQIIEALLFASNKPLTCSEIKEVLEETETPEIKSQLAALKQEYQDSGRSFNIQEIAGGYQIATNPQFASWLSKLYTKSRKEKLSRPSLETLAIIAYRQPVTRLEIEDIRGVNVDGVVKTLLDRYLVRISGRKQIPGRPFLYGTTKQFLELFGLQSLSDLPKIEEFEELIRRGEQDVQVSEVTPEDRPDRQ